MKYRLLTIEGNIGAGKTTLCQMLAKDYSTRLVLEQFEENPFLPKFFEDFKQQAFSTELYFMAERYHQLSAEMPEPELFSEALIMDYLFTKSLLYAKVNLADDEFQLFKRLFDIINPRLPQADLLVYIHSDLDRLIDNIRNRGRGFEQTIQRDYLQSLQDTYFDYFRHNPQLPILVLDCTNCDYVKYNDHYLAIRNMLELTHEKGTHFYRFAGTSFVSEGTL